MAEIKFDLASYVLRNARGEVDINATHQKFTQQIAELVQSEKLNNDVIARAVQSTFEEHKVELLSMNALLHYTMEKLTVDPDEFAAVRERVAEYVRGNKARFSVRKGKGGGVSWKKEEAPAAAAPATPAPPSSAGTLSIRPRESTPVRIQG